MKFLYYLDQIQSNWWLRTITGAIYAVGFIWFAYPLMAETSRDLILKPQA